MSKSKLRIIPLGGLDEIGKNMTAFEYGNEIILVDCGMAFPDEDMPGVDMVINDISYLEKNKEKLKGIFLTHGHEDHIGGLPYFLKSINVPVYGTRLTIALVEHKLKEHNLLSKVKVINVRAGNTVTIGKHFSIEFIRTNHSIADSVALAITTPQGTVIHMGDFKIDSTPIVGDMIDLTRLGELGKRGVLALMSDSTNVERGGYAMSERSVGEKFENIFKDCKKRIIVATFASNVHRVQQIINAAAANGRKVAVSGRSMLNFVNAATRLGYLNVPDKMMIDLNDAQKYPPEMVTIITTGSQGEPMSALYRMAFGEHNQVSLGSNDLVVLSSSAIPGNEKLITKIINELFKRGTEVITYSNYDVHVSGHACREELKLIHSLTSPEFFMPVHGEYKHLIAHAGLAHEMGMREEKIVIPENGRVVEMSKRSLVPTGHVQAGAVMVDGTGSGEVSDVVLRDRKRLSEDGIIIVTAGVDLDFMTISVYPEVISRGFVYEKENEDLIGRITESARNSLIRNLAKGIDDIEVLRSKLRDDVAEYARKRTKHRPMIVVMLSDIQQ